MATLWFSVFEDAAEVAIGSPIQEGTIAVGAGSTQGAVINASNGDKKYNRRVRIFSDTDCHVTWGENPTATTSNLPMGAENPEYFDIRAGERIAVIERL